MRVYSSTCQDFIRDVGTGQIAAIVERAYTRAYGHSTSESEIRSWKNSLAALSNILDHGDVPSDLGLGIEFGGNESVMEQLGITEEQVPVIAGSIGILILIIGGFVYYRRKGREYE